MEHYTILVIEDDPLLRADASVLLAEAGFAVEAYESAAAAASVIAERGAGIGAVFTDVNTAGGMNGIELAVLVTAQWPDITVLVTSGASPERPEALPTAVRFMPKPWLPLEVLVEMQRGAEAQERRLMV